MRLLTVLATCLLTAACAVDGAVRHRAAAEITPEAFNSYVTTLASDEFEGRKPASHGEQVTIEYLEKEFLALGLQPANGGSFRQGVPMVEITATSDASLSVAAADGTRLPLRIGDDVVMWTKRVQPTVSLAPSELVFVGYGINAPEYGWNDYAGVDMRGKTAVVLINDPGYVTGDPTLFNGKALTYHGRWTYKYEEAARQGAAAVMIIHDTAPAAYGWATVRNSWMGPQLDLDSPDGNAGRVAIESWISGEAAGRMFQMAGLDLAALKASAAQRGFRAVPMGLKAEGGVRNIIRRSKSNNVAGVMPGSEKPDEYVVYLAHWDHLGRSLSLAGGDSIFNGAVDNATGVAGILSIARAYRSMMPRSKRSVLFLAVTGEESGLLGSAHYAEHPIVPLEKTAAVINLDGMAPLGRARDVVVIGAGASELEDYLADAARAQDRVVRPDPVPENGYFYRSDHFNFAKKGVPALYIDSGTDIRGRPAGWAKAQLDDYTAKRYHQVGDNYDPAWDISGIMEDLVLAFEVGARVASEDRWPNWRQGNEFRAARDASESARR